MKRAFFSFASWVMAEPARLAVVVMVIGLLTALVLSTALNPGGFFIAGDAPSGSP